MQGIFPRTRVKKATAVIERVVPSACKGDVLSGPEGEVQRVRNLRREVVNLAPPTVGARRVDICVRAAVQCADNKPGVFIYLVD